MSAVTIQQMADRVSTLLTERLRLRDGTLDDKLRRAGRRLPRQVREAGAVMAQAQAMTHNPKLMMQIDDATVATAYDICVRHLGGLDPAAARKGMMLNLVASVAFSLLVVAVLLVAVLYWRGFV